MAKPSKKSSEKPTDKVEPSDSKEPVSSVEATPDAEDDIAQDTVDAAIAEAEMVEGASSADATPEADDTAEPASEPGDTIVADGADTLADGDDAVASREADDTLSDGSDPVADPEPTHDPEPTPTPGPTVVQEKVIERKAGFVPTLIGGVIAAGLGFAAAQFGTFGEDDTLFRTDTETALAAQREQVQSLISRVESVEDSVQTIDLAPLQGAVDGVQGQFADLDQVLAALGGRIDALDTRMTELEKQPMSQALSPEAVAAYEREMQALRDAVAAQKAEVESLAAEAIAAQNDANTQAQLAESRSALADLTARLQAGDPYAEPLSILTANGVNVPQAVADAAAEGVPTLAALVSDFPDAARAALKTARTVEAPEQGGGFGSFLQSQLGARSVVPREGDDADAVLSRAEAAVKGGDLATALEEIAKLPAEAQAELSDWTARASLRRDALAGAATLAQDLNQQ